MVFITATSVVSMGVSHGHAHGHVHGHVHGHAPGHTPSPVVSMGPKGLKLQLACPHGQLAWGGDRIVSMGHVTWGSHGYTHGVQRAVTNMCARELSEMHDTYSPAESEHAPKATPIAGQLGNVANE